MKKKKPDDRQCGWRRGQRYRAPRRPGKMFWLVKGKDVHITYVLYELREKGDLQRHQYSMIFCSIMGSIDIKGAQGRTVWLWGHHHCPCSDWHFTTTHRASMKFIQCILIILTECVSHGLKTGRPSIPSWKYTFKIIHRNLTNMLKFDRIYWRWP